MAAIFSDIKTPYVNETTVRRVLSSKIKDNIFQGIFTKPGEAVTERYSNDTTAGEIQIVRFKPNSLQAREIGSDVNGGWFNSADAQTATTEAYGIKILTTIDYNIDIPTNQQDMLNVDVLEAEMANLAGKVNKNINALTFAAQLAKNFNDVKAGTISDNKVTIEGDDYLSAIISAGAALDDGNESQGIDSYPDDQRAVFLRSSAKASLLKKGQVIVGGSDKAQEILRRGGFDSDTDPSVATTGYLGEIDGMPCYVASKPVWALAEKYMGLTAGALDKVEMLVVSGVSTGRALAFADNVKIIDAPGGNGRRLQPCFRFGCDCWDGLSVVPVVKADFKAPEGTITVKAPGSRA